MEQTKLSLSAQELAMVTDPGIILTKNGVLQKMQTALYALYAWQQDFAAKNSGLAAAFETNGKVAKGENYKGLPYVLLDYPRNFTPDHFFSVRSMFWWGRQVSTTLHLSGSWMQQFTPRLCEQLTLLQENSFYVSYNGDEWDHDLNGGAYHPLGGMPVEGLQKMAEADGFLKIAAFIPINELADAPAFWRNSFRTLMEILFKS